MATPPQDRGHGGRHRDAHPRRDPRSCTKDGRRGLRRGHHQDHGGSYRAAPGDRGLRSEAEGSFSTPSAGRWMFSTRNCGGCSGGCCPTIGTGMRPSGGWMAPKAPCRWSLRGLRWTPDGRQRVRLGRSLCRLPLARQTLRLGDFSGGHVGGDMIAVMTVRLPQYRNFLSRSCQIGTKTQRIVGITGCVMGRRYGCVLGRRYFRGSPHPVRQGRE